eukprot:g3806.t1
MSGEEQKMRISSAAGGSVDEGEAVNQFTVEAELGRGAFATVHLCLRDDGKHFAIKEFHKSLLKRKRNFRRVKGKVQVTSNMDYVKREVALVKKLNHPNVVRCYQVIDDPASDKLYMVMEFVSLGQVVYWQPAESRYGRKGTDDPIPQTTARDYFRDVILGLEYLHQSNIAHRDLKPENLLVSQDGRCKITDFGVSKMFDEGSSGMVTDTEGTHAYFSPESCSGKEYSAYLDDVWALGVCLYAMVVGELPFFHREVSILFDIIENEAYKPLPADMSPAFSALIAGILEKNPSKRLTMAQLQENEWVNERHAHRLSDHKSHAAIKISDEDMANAFTPVSRFILIPRLKAKMRKITESVRARLDKRRLKYVEVVEAVKRSDVDAVKKILDDAEESERPFIVNPPSHTVAANVGIAIHCAPPTCICAL